MTQKTHMFGPAVMLILLWSILVARPFRVFAEMVGLAADSIAGGIGLSGVPSVLAVYAASMAVAVLIFLFMRSRYAELAAGLCALSASVFHLAGNIADHAFTSVSVSVTVGLAIVLACLAFKAKGVSRWLGGAYGTSIAVMLSYDLVLLPLKNKLLPDLAVPSFMDLDVFRSAQSAMAYDRPIHWILAAGLTLVSFLVLRLAARGRKETESSTIIR